MSIMSKPDHWIKKILVATPIMGRDSTSVSYTHLRAHET